MARGLYTISGPRSPYRFASFGDIVSRMPDVAKVALVTGAARRVGRAIAGHLAQAGYDVAFTYLQSENDAKSLVDEITALGRHSLAIRANLTELPNAIDAIETQFRGSFTRLDVLVNNASLYEPADLAGTDLALSRRLMSIHLEAPMLLAQRFAPDLRQARGHIVNMVDLLAQRPLPAYLAYCASKAALLNLTLGLARELAPQVTVNAIAPGAVEWPDNFPQAQREKYLQRVPLARAGTPAEVAQAVLFLCTQGTYLTGQVLRLDGGRSIT